MDGNQYILQKEFPTSRIKNTCIIDSSCTITKSELDDIQGIGEKRKKALLNHFKDIEAIKKATFEELLEVEGMNKASSESVYKYFRKGK